MDEQRAVTVVPVSEMDKSPAGMMAMAVANGQDLVQLEKLLDLQIRWEENEAKKAYHKAMAAFKSDPPKIDKDQHVKFETAKGKTEYKHASLANVTDKINRALSEHGLSAGWKQAQGEGGILSVTCTITHELGHSESTTLSAGLDLSGGKNNIQALGSTNSYLERYTILALTGLATKEMDDDGVGSEQPEYVTGDQRDEIVALLAFTNSANAAFWNFAGGKNIDEIPLKNANKVIAMLRKKKAGMEKPKTRQPGDEG